MNCTQHQKITQFQIKQNYVKQFQVKRNHAKIIMLTHVKTLDIETHSLQIDETKTTKYALVFELSIETMTKDYCLERTD